MKFCNDLSLGPGVETERQLDELQRQAVDKLVEDIRKEQG